MQIHRSAKDCSGRWTRDRTVVVRGTDSAHTVFIRPPTGLDLMQKVSHALIKNQMRPSQKKMLGPFGIPCIRAPQVPIYELIPEKHYCRGRRPHGTRQLNLTTITGRKHQAGDVLRNSDFAHGFLRLPFVFYTFCITQAFLLSTHEFSKIASCCPRVDQPKSSFITSLNTFNPYRPIVDTFCYFILYSSHLRSNGVSIHRQRLSTCADSFSLHISLSLSLTHTHTLSLSIYQELCTNASHSANNKFSF